MLPIINLIFLCVLEIVNYYLHYFVDKIAEKFAKKINFSYESISPTLTKKELKLSLDRACLKYLKKNVGSSDINGVSANDNSKKRQISNTNESEDNEVQPPKKKKKVVYESCSQV